MRQLLDSLTTLLKKHDAKIVSFSMDEIIVSGINKEILIDFLNSKPIGDNSLIAEKYLKVDEFTLKEHRLKCGKKFYVKYFTNNDQPPCLRNIDPQNKLDAIEMVIHNYE